METTTKKKKLKGEQFIVKLGYEFRSDACVYRITMQDGSPLGPRLMKGESEWPDYPAECVNEDDAILYMGRWEDWVNKQNEGIKRYFK